MNVEAGGGGKPPPRGRMQHQRGRQAAPARAAGLLSVGLLGFGGLGQPAGTPARRPGGGGFARCCVRQAAPSNAQGSSVGLLGFSSFLAAPPHRGCGLGRPPYEGQQPGLPVGLSHLCGFSRHHHPRRGGVRVCRQVGRAACGVSVLSWCRPPSRPRVCVLPPPPASCGMFHVEHNCSCNHLQM